MPDRIDTSRVRRLTMHCRRCQHKIGERAGGVAIFGEVYVRKRVEVSRRRCGHRWYENDSRTGYVGDVRTS